MGSFAGDRNGYTLETIRPRLERLYRAGYSYEVIGQRLGLSRWSVRYWLRRCGIGPVRKPVDHDKVVELRLQGLKHTEIAALVGCCEKSVRDHLRPLGMSGHSFRRAILAERGERELHVWQKHWGKQAKGEAS